MRVIGLMSGTSFDAIEAAAADFDLRCTDVILRPLGSLSVSYPTDLQAMIAAILPPAATSIGAVCEIDTRIGQAFAEAAALANEQLASGEAEVVVSHGQTVYHWVEGAHARGTLQLGQPAWIAARTGLTVVSDLRSRDIAAGGQGAPLVSLFDVLLLGGETTETRAALNLGGIANLTIMPPAAPPFAFDTGPANALMDAVVAHRTGGRESFDRDGARAARGRPHRVLLDRLLADPYYALPPPRSTGREYFSLTQVQESLRAVGIPSIDAIGEDDLLATLAALTVEVVRRSCAEHDVTELVAAGGGTRNPVLMRGLTESLPGTRIRTIDDWGIPVAAKEAYAFALLGFLSVHGLSGTVPSCTGAREPTVLGRINPGRAPLRLPHRPGSSPTRLRIDVGGAGRGHAATANS
jgi:anhydro-N-acetylmuramic acid kinase